MVVSCNPYTNKTLIVPKKKIIVHKEEGVLSKASLTMIMDLILD